MGRYCAIGDAAETIILLQLCDSLHKPQHEERAVISEIFEREKSREENLKKQRLENEARRNLALKEQKAKQDQRQNDE